jgi:hypothetical protein
MTDPRFLLPQTTVPADFLDGLLDRWDKAMFAWQETFLHAWAEHDWKMTHLQLQADEPATFTEDDHEGR